MTNLQWKLGRRRPRKIGETERGEALAARKADWALSSVAGSRWWMPENKPENEVEERAGVAASNWPGAAASERPGAATEEAAGSAVPFCALVAFTFVLLLAPQSFVPGLASLRIGLLTAAAAITACLFDRLTAKRAPRPASREWWLAVALVLWAFLTLPFSMWPGGSLSLLLEGFLKAVAIFWLVPNVVTTPARLRRLCVCLCLLSAPIAAYAAKQYLSGSLVGEGAVKRIFSFEAPLTQNPNDLALMLNLILPLGIALFLSGGAKTRLLFAGLIALDAAAVILTFSRAGFLALAATLALYGARLMSRPGRGLVVAAVVVIALAVPFLPGGYAERLGTITDIQADPTGSAQERWADTLAALQFVARHPVVGAGVGMNVLALNAIRGPEWKQVHNVYLEYAVDLGLPGLALFAMLLAGCLGAAGAARRSQGGPAGGAPIALLGEGVQTSLAAFAIEAAFHPVAYHFYFFYIAGLALAARSVSGRARPAAAMPMTIPEEAA